MARRGKNDIEVGIIGEADFGRARKDAARDLDQIEKEAKETTKDIERAFDRVELSPELDSTEIRQALDLADQLDGTVAKLTVDTDLDEIKEAEKIARSLRAFQGRVDLSVEGRDELKDSLDLAEKLDQIRAVKVQVQGREDLKRAADLADDLERKRTIEIDVDRSDLNRLDEQITEAGEAGAEGIADAIGGIDFGNLGGTALDQLTGALAAAGPWAAAAAAIGVAFGDDLAGGIGDAIGANRRAILGSLSSGIPVDDVRRIGSDAGNAFSDGFGDSMEEVRQDALDLVDNLADLPTALDDSALIRYGLTAKQVFGIDIPDQVEITRRLIGNDLVATTEEAYQLMAASAQTFGFQSEEILDVLSEYAPVLDRLGFSAEDALGAVGTGAQGVFENTDMAADSLKEFLARLDSLDSADALAKLGLDIEKVQAAISEGRADEFFETLADRLRGVTNESERMAIATEIMGTAIEGANLDKVLVWLDEIGENAPVATQGIDEMADSVENTHEPWAKFGRGVRDTTGDILAFAQSGSESLTEFERQTEAFKDHINETGEDITFTDFVERMNDELEKSAEIARLLRFDEVKSQLNEVASDFDLTTDAVADLAAEFDALDGRFDAARGFRRIQDQSDDLLGSVEDLEDGLFLANGEFDRSDPAVRRFESTLEGLNETLIDSARAFDDGTIEADQFRAMQRQTEDAIRRAGQAAGLSTAEVDRLVEMFTRIPPSVQTDIDAETAAAHNELQRFLRVAESSTATVTLDADGSIANNELQRFLRVAAQGVTVPVRSSSAPAPRAPAPSRPPARQPVGAANRRAAGGPTTGLTLVGEEGPELADFGDGGAFIHNAPDTRRILAGSPAARSFNQAQAAGPSAAPIVFDFRTDGSALAELMIEFLRMGIANRGGTVEAVIGRGAP